MLRYTKKQTCSLHYPAWASGPRTAVLLRGPPLGELARPQYMDADSDEKGDMDASPGPATKLPALPAPPAPPARPQAVPPVRVDP